MMEEARQRLSEFVQNLPRFIGRRLSPQEQALAVHLRGNDSLRKALADLIEARLKQRASVHEPSDPIACKSIVARDRELQWLLSRLESIYRSPVNQEAEEGEPPA